MGPVARKRFRRLGARPSILLLDLAASGAYVATLRLLGSLAGTPRLDGIIGVVLGLAVGSHPATNFLDMLIYWRVEGPLYTGRRALAWWLVLNAVVLLAGGVVIAFGATRFAVPRRP